MTDSSRWYTLSLILQSLKLTDEPYHKYTHSGELVPLIDGSAIIYSPG